jgi:hypothetical protein
VRRLPACLLLGAVFTACASAPAQAPTRAPVPSSPATQTAAQAAYLAVVEPLPDLIGPDVAAYNTHCANLATAVCVQALEQFGSDMDGFLSALPSVAVPAAFQAGNTALRKALADLVGTLATHKVAINKNTAAVEDDARGAV